MSTPAPNAAAPAPAVCADDADHQGRATKPTVVIISNFPSQIRKETAVYTKLGYNAVGVYAVPDTKWGLYPVEPSRKYHEPHQTVLGAPVEPHHVSLEAPEASRFPDKDSRAAYIASEGMEHGIWDTADLIRKMRELKPDAVIIPDNADIAAAGDRLVPGKKAVLSDRKSVAYIMRNAFTEIPCVMDHTGGVMLGDDYHDTDYHGHDASAERHAMITTYLNTAIAANKAAGVTVAG